jgi:16S rRNA (adenine1518-N6/adenine1519-N6)-dimethyltransferase
MKDLTQLNRSLGQNFFTNRSLAKKIVEEVLDSNPKLVIEIGSGLGAFTNLISKETEVISIEKDQKFSKHLKKRLNIQVISKDVLEVTICELTKGKSKPVVFGSLPYNIAKRIIRRNIKEECIKEHFYIIQKEVAEKYCSEPPNSNILSITSKAYAKTEILFDIPPSSFRPQPGVYSSLIKFTPHRDHKEKREEKFFGFVKRCFKHPRKKLRNNLSKKEKKKLTQDSKRIQELSSRRAERLNINEFYDLYRTVQPEI